MCSRSRAALLLYTLRYFSSTRGYHLQCCGLCGPRAGTKSLRSENANLKSRDLRRSRRGLRVQSRNSIRRVARSVWRAARVARSVARSYGPPEAPSGPATYKHREGSGSRRSCSIGAQNHRDVDLLRAAQSMRQCGGNWLVRRAPTDGPARCLSAKTVPHRERMPRQPRQTRLDRRLCTPD